VLIGEYRNSKSEMLKWRDKMTGAAKEGPICRHTIEGGGISYAAAARIPDGTKLEDIRIPFRKGDAVVIRFTEYTTTRGAVAVRGELEKLQDGSSPRSPGLVPTGGRGVTSQAAS